jgi:hypothetical protein
MEMRAREVQQVPDLLVPPEGTEYLYTVEVREIIKAA